MIVPPLTTLGAAAVVIAAAGSAADPATVQLYRLKCQSCHLADGRGAVPAMDLTDGKWIHGGSQADVVRVISDGVRGTAMVAYRDQLTPKQIAALARLVRSFDKAAKANRAGPDSGRGGPLTAGARWD